MKGLYALKPWFGDQLIPFRERLSRRRVSPNAVTFSGILFALAAAISLALVPAPFATLPVAFFLVARLACANLDGSLSRETGQQTRLGTVFNEIGDRAADLTVVVGLLPHISWALMLGALLASSVPSWVSLAGAAAGVERVNGGPMGKTERCLIAIVAAASSWYALAAVVVIAGSLLTALLRLLHVAARCKAAPLAPDPGGLAQAAPSLSHRPQDGERAG